MPDPAQIEILWVEKLYSASIKSQIRVLRGGPDQIEAVVCNAFGWSCNGIIEERYYEEGCQLLVKTQYGCKIEDIASGAEPPLRSRSQDDHLYRPCLPVCDDDGLCWRVFLHVDFVLVLPARGQLCAEALILLEIPQSNHEKINLAARVSGLQTEARDLFSFAWPDGFVLADPEGFLPEDFA